MSTFILNFIPHTHMRAGMLVRKEELLNRVMCITGAESAEYIAADHSKPLVNGNWNRVRLVNPTCRPAIVKQFANSFATKPYWGEIIK